jgi:hypothetical protein
MKRTYRFVEACGVIGGTLEDGVRVELPVFGGILKHPTLQQLAGLLTDPAVARKYTREALRTAPWSALRRFPRWWLMTCLTHASLRDGRRRALEFMLVAEGK